MARGCTACAHTARADFDPALATGRATVRDIARRTGLSKDAVHRHLRKCIAAAVAEAEQERRAAVQQIVGAAVVEHGATEVIRELDLAQSVHRLLGDARRLQLAAEKAGDSRLALVALDSQRRTLELLGRLRGELASGTTVNVLNVGRSDELSPEELEHEARLALEQAERMRAAALPEELPSESVSVELSSERAA